MASRVLGAFVVTGTAVLASLALATPASAHTPAVEVKCDEKAQKSVLTVDLTNYGWENKNTLTVVIDGKEEPVATFGRELRNQKWERNSTEKHTYKVTVKAYDDPNFDKKKGWSKVWDLSNDKCVKTPQKPEQPQPPQPEKPQQPEQPPNVVKPPVETTPETPSSSVTPPPPGGATPEPPLAATGASPLWLLLSGLGLVGAGAGTLMFLRRRRA